MALRPEFMRMRAGLFSDVPRMPAVLQPEQQPGGRIGRALGMVFGGQDDPNLSAQQNEQARRQAMLMAGLGILGSDASGLKAIAQGAMVGQQMGMAGRQQMGQDAARQQRQERLRAAIGNGQIDRDTLQKLMVEAIIAGDTEASGDLSEVIKSMGNAAGPQAPVRGSPEWLAALDAELAVRDKYRAPSAPVPGTPEYEAALEQRARIAAKYRPAPRTAAGSEDERKAASFLAFTDEPLAFVETYAGAPTRVQQALSDKGLREFTDEDQQRLNLAAIAIGEAWLRMTTGAGYNQEEQRNAGYMFVPRPGDKAGTLADKAKMRKRLRELLKVRAGRVLSQGVGDEVPADGADFDPFEGL